MKRILYGVLLLVIACSITSCNLFNNSSTYTSTTKTFTDALLAADYNKCISLINFDAPPKQSELMQFKVGLDSLRNKIGRDYGTELEYSFMSAQKKVSDTAGYTVPENTTLVYIELNNSKYIGVLKVLFDDKSGKIDNIQKVGFMHPVPRMTTFWLFSILAAAVVAYNLYIIVLVYKSKLKMKWLYYLGILVLNVPALQYHVTQGIDLKFFAYQYFLGVGFQHLGYLGSVWAIGVPVGAIIAGFKLSFPPPELKPAKSGKNKSR